MSKKSRLIKNFFVVAAPILANSIFGISPSIAATFAFSNSEVEFTNFSQAPSNVRTFTDTDALVIENGGIIRAIPQAEAVFLIEPAEAFNSSLSEAFGESEDYLGFAESEASVIGNFDIEANTNFSFDFSGDLELSTSIENPPKENARASGDISFELVDTQNNHVLEFFDVIGNITTEGDHDFVRLNQSDNVILSDIVTEPDFGGLQEFMRVSIEGSLERHFADETTVALVEVKRNRARVTAPEPSASLALLLSSSVISLVLKRRRK